MKRILRIPINETQAALGELSDGQTARLFRGLLYTAQGIAYTESDETVRLLIAVLTASDKRATADRTAEQSEETAFSVEEPISQPELDDPAPFLRKVESTDVLIEKENDNSKEKDKENFLSYQPVKKVEKSKRRVRVEEKEINKEKEERSEEKKKAERSLPSSLPPSETESYVTDIRQALSDSGRREKLNADERKRLRELDKIKDIRDVSKEDMELLEKAEVIDLRTLVLSLRCYNEAMTDMIPEYTVNKKRLKKAKDVFEHALETDSPLPYLFKRASESSFLCGYKSFRGADYDWLMREDRVDKVLSGYYDDYKTRRN